jgi:hypothetical protein
MGWTVVARHYRPSHLLHKALRPILSLLGDLQMSRQAPPPAGRLTLAVQPPPRPE